jgi:hypothetical protein
MSNPARFRKTGSALLLLAFACGGARALNKVH